VGIANQNKVRPHHTLDFNLNPIELIKDANSSA
jgi:hypothetical protein